MQWPVNGKLVLDEKWRPHSSQKKSASGIEVAANPYDLAGVVEIGSTTKMPAESTGPNELAQVFHGAIAWLVESIPLKPGRLRHSDHLACIVDLRCETLKTAQTAQVM